MSGFRNMTGGPNQMHKTVVYHAARIPNQPIAEAYNSSQRSSIPFQDGASDTVKASSVHDRRCKVEE